MGQSEWVLDHLQRYKASNGEDGHFWVLAG